MKAFLVQPEICAITKNSVPCIIFDIFCSTGVVSKWLPFFNLGPFGQSFFTVSAIKGLHFIMNFHMDIQPSDKFSTDLAFLNFSFCTISHFPKNVLTVRCLLLDKLIDFDDKSRINARADTSRVRKD